MRIKGFIQIPKPRPVEFICRKCGCVFEAERGEYTLHEHYDRSQEYFSCTCPNCNSIVTRDAH